MKKFLLAIPVLLLASGCGSKSNTLECTASEDLNGIGMETVISAKFKGGKASSASAVVTMTFESEEEAQEYLEAYGSDEDSANIKVEGNKLIISADEEVSGADSGVSKAELKETLEEEGYKCK